MKVIIVPCNGIGKSYGTVTWQTACAVTYLAVMTRQAEAEA